MMKTTESKPLIDTLEEIFGIVIGDNDVMCADTPAKLAEQLTSWFTKVAGSEPVEFAGTFVRLQGSLAEEFCLPRASFNPATPWRNLRLGFPADFFRSKWRRLRRSFPGLPRLMGPNWPWMLLDLAFIPAAPLLYYAVGGGSWGIVSSLLLLLSVGILSLVLSRSLGTRTPHETIGESAKEIARAGMSQHQNDLAWMRMEISFILHEVLEVELEGRSFTDETPFQMLGIRVRPDRC